MVPAYVKAYSPSLIAMACFDLVVYRPAKAVLDAIWIQL